MKEGKTMRVTDLMVGDWVSVSGKPVKLSKDDLATMLIFLDDDLKSTPSLSPRKSW